MEQDQQKHTLEESSRPEAIGVTRAMHQSKVRGRKRERNKHGFLAALLVLAMVALVAGAAFLLKALCGQRTAAARAGRVDDLLSQQHRAYAGSAFPDGGHHYPATATSRVTR